MGTCEHCGNKFPQTRATRKYCSPRCKTNACLDRKPSRLRAADVQAIYELLGGEFDCAEELKERLRSIVAPQMPPIPVEQRAEERVVIPSLD